MSQTENTNEAHQAIMEQDGFTVYHKSNRFGKKVSNARAKTSPSSSFKYKPTASSKKKEETFDEVIQRFNTKVEMYMDQLETHTFLTQLEENISFESNPVHFICYGIGDLLASSISQLQFACFLLLRDRVKGEVTECKMYDPVIALNYTGDQYGQFIETLSQKYSIQWLTENNECKHVCTENTVFFMPHCSRQMYCNVVHSNLAVLSRLIIIGNSFTSYVIRSPSELLSLFEIEVSTAKNTKARNRNDSFELLLFQSFNDTAIHKTAKTRVSDLAEENVVDVEISSR